MELSTALVYIRKRRKSLTSLLTYRPLRTVFESCERLTLERRLLLLSSRRAPKPILNMPKKRRLVCRNANNLDAFLEKKRSKSKKRSERLNVRRGNSVNGRLRKPRQSDKRSEILEDASVKLRKLSARLSDRRSEMNAERLERRSERIARKSERLEDALAINVENTAPGPDRETDLIAAIGTAAEAAGATVVSAEDEIAQERIENVISLKR